MLKFTVPSLPPSMNAIYNIMWGMRRVEMKPEVRCWKNQTKDYIPRWEEKREEGGLLWIQTHFHGNWNTKAGKVRVIDLPNMLKVTIDAVAEKLGFNDSMIFEQRSRKVQDKDEKIEIELGYIE